MGAVGKAEGWLLWFVGLLIGIASTVLPIALGVLAEAKNYREMSNRDYITMWILTFVITTILSWKIAFSMGKFKQARHENSH